MVNLIKEEKKQLQSAVAEAFERAGFGPADGFQGSVSYCQTPVFGDFFANHALHYAPKLGISAEELAAVIAENIRAEECSSVKADKGFVNFTLSDAWHSAVLEAKLSELSSMDIPPHEPAPLIGRLDVSNPLYFTEYSRKRCYDLCRLYENGGFAPEPDNPAFSAEARKLIKYLAGCTGPDYGYSLSLGEALFAWYSQKNNGSLTHTDCMILKTAGKVYDLCLNSYGKTVPSLSRRSTSK